MTTQYLSNESSESRIKWIDIAKGITIILVVIGHSTGLFNHYIYQFHMATFLILSGYTANLSKRNFLASLYSKIRSLLIPFFTIFIFLTVACYFLNRLNLFHFLFGAGSVFIGLKNTVLAFLTKGDNYIYWMGAGWFVIVLFEVFLIHKIISALINNIWLHSSISFGLYLLGYVLVYLKITTTLSFFYIDLALIAQFYFSIGLLLREKKVIEKIMGAKEHAMAIALVTLCILIYLAKVKHIVVDYPSRNFSDPFIDAIAALNGCLFISSISLLISKSKWIRIKDMLKYLGRKSIAILYLHFAAFKVSFLLLILFGVMPASQFGSFVPPAEVSQLYWPFIVAISIAVSLLAWNLCCHIPPIGFLLYERKRQDKLQLYLIENGDQYLNKIKLKIHMLKNKKE